MFLNMVHVCSLQNQRHLGGRVLSFLLVKIVAAIFSFYCRERLGREKKFVPRGCTTVKRKERGGVGQ